MRLTRKKSLLTRTIKIGGARRAIDDCAHPNDLKIDLLLILREVKLALPSIIVSDVGVLVALAQFEIREIRLPKKSDRGQRKEKERRCVAGNAIEAKRSNHRRLEQLEQKNFAGR